MHAHSLTFLRAICWICFVAVWGAAPALAQSEALTRNYQRGSSLFEAGMYGASAPYFEKALELSDEEFGQYSSRTGFILKNLATVYARQGKFAEAEPLYVRALKIFEDAFGPDHGLVAEVTNELSIVYVERKRFIEAEPLLGRVLESLEQKFGADDPRVAVAAYNYGYASEYLGDAEKARKLYARALEIWQSQPLPDDKLVRAAQDRLASLSRARENQGPSLAPYLPRVLDGSRDKQQTALAPASESPPAPVTRDPVAPAAVREATAGWRVQLASFRSRDTAEKESDRLSKGYAALFGPVGGLKVAEAVLEKGTFYRLVAGPFADREAAAALCRDLKTRQQGCIVIRQAPE